MQSPRASNEEQRPQGKIRHPASHQGAEILTGHTGQSSNRSHQEHLSLHQERDGGNMKDGDEPPWAGQSQSHSNPWNSRERASVKDSGQTISRKKERTEPASGQPDDGQGSEISSLTMSEEVELDQLSSPCVPSDDEENGLTMTDDPRSKGTRRRRADTPDRTAGPLQFSRVGPKLADRSVLKTLFFNSLLVASWYIFSLSISIYNTWMFSPKHLDFHFPLFTTCLHMLVQFCLAALVLYLVPHLRPRADHISNLHDRGHVESSQPAKPLMTRMFYLTRIGPCGAATGLDIGLGNMSLKFISLTFYTMCKSSSLAFVLTFAFLFRLETPSVQLVSIIVVMTIGVIMMVAGEVDFDGLGFVLVILAALFSGFRWSLTQILLLRSPATSNPFSSIFFLAPIMFLSLAIIAGPVEGFGDLGRGLRILMEVKGGLLGTGILLFPGLLAFLMTASEFALLQRTSVVTLSICGIFKEVVTISAAGIAFHDPLTPINVSGLLVTIASIAAYNYIKISKMRADARLPLEDEPRTWDTADDADNDEANQALLGTTREHESKLDFPPDRENGLRRSNEGAAQPVSIRDE